MKTDSPLCHCVVKQPVPAGTVNTSGKIWCEDHIEQDVSSNGSYYFSGLVSNCSTDTYTDIQYSNTLKYMLNLNRMYMKESDSTNLTEPMFLSGGLQHYLIRSKSLASSDQQPRKGYGSESKTFHDLPDSLQLHVFSYLEAKDLCTVTLVCSHWLLLASDNLLWQTRLQHDIKHWSVIGHSTNPDIFEECQADFTTKQIYLRCSPLVKESLQRSQAIGVHNISHFVVNTIRSFLPKKIPKLVMFGPGLESNTSTLVRKIIEGQSDMFKATGMFPGQFGGIGSGFTMKMNNCTTFNLVTLYTSTWQERQNRPYKERLQINRMLNKNNQSGDNLERENEEELQQFEVNSSIKDLCRTTDGFVFVVDASIEDTAAMQVARTELFSMVNDNWCDPAAPLLVLSCIPAENNRLISCINIVRQLKLSRLNRPWQVHNCVVDNMSGFVSALDWIVQTTQRK